MTDQENSGGDLTARSECCAVCSFFDQRTGFCRLRPPQVVMTYANRMAFPTAVWPKVPMPQLDWCGEFEKKGAKML